VRAAGFGGNPGPCTGDPNVIQKVCAIRDAAYLVTQIAKMTLGDGHLASDFESQNLADC
jgi:hypothetical protein